MALGKSVKERIKALAKDAKSYEDLLELITSATKRGDTVFNDLQSSGKSFFEDYFWSVTDYKNSNKVIYSSNVESITGYTPAELNKMPGRLFSIVSDEDVEKTKREYTKFLSDTNSNNFKLTFRVTTKEGQILWIRENYIAHRDKEGRVTTVETISCDITDLIDSCKELESKYEKLEELLLEKDKFISIISHDLRSPFTSLLGFSEILMKQSDVTTDESQEYIGYIHEASKMQLQFINNLLDWSRLQMGRIKLEPARVRLIDIISNSQSLATRDAIAKNITIDRNIPEGLFVNADARLLGEVIKNLLDNAIKYSHEDSRIEIKANTFKEGKVEVVIKDEGVGIAEEDQSKLFRIDEKFILKGTRGERGAGMGLNLVKEIIDKHEGDVWFYSKPGEGSEFHFTIPEAHNVILIVEDNIELGKMYQSVLAPILPNFRILLAGNGYEAMRTVYMQLPSLVITDHDMPLMSGTQLVEAVRKKDKHNEVPVIVISANFDSSSLEIYNRLGVQYLMDKPFEIEKFSETVQKIIEDYLS